MSLNFKDIIKTKSVAADWIDLRDQEYLPNLSVLRDEVSLNNKLMSIDPQTGLNTPIFGVRHQGKSGRCVGFAMANLIDIQRNLQELRRSVKTAAKAGQKEKPFPRGIVSADMLYHMAYFHDRYPDLQDQNGERVDGVRTLRSAIKGFYHHGVCEDWPHAIGTADPGVWQSNCYDALSVDINRYFPTVEQAKAARKIGLGAYFRVASVLNHFHAALNDAEAVLTSANIHDGWWEATPENQGEISWPPKQGIAGTHAFVLTGYDEKGFHVLNSWGSEWGGYNNQAGIALWPYEDWAQNVVDSWVLRLSVFAPTAFGASIGEQGTKGTVGRVRSGSTPCSELVGHYTHLDDGLQVSTGSYPSFAKGWSDTRRYLSDMLDPNAPVDPKGTKYKGVLLWIPGSLEGVKEAFDSATQRKGLIKGLGLYPYSIFWCNSFVEKSLEVLTGLFDSSAEQVGKDAKHLDDLIETRVSGVGRAFWRDIEIGARRTVLGWDEHPYKIDATDPDMPVKSVEPGYALKCVLDLIELKKTKGCEIHIVAEGAGALVVHEILEALEILAETFKTDADPDWNPKDVFDTVHLIFPAIGMPRANEVLVPFLNKMNGTVEGTKRRTSTIGKAAVRTVIKSDTPRRACVYIPRQDLEKRIHFGDYGKSILHLVSRSFEDRTAKNGVPQSRIRGTPNKPRTFLGMAKVADCKSFTALSALFQLSDIAAPLREHDRVSQQQLNKDTIIPDHIFEAIKTYRDTK